MNMKEHRQDELPSCGYVCSKCGFSSKRWSKWKKHLEVGHERAVDVLTAGSELDHGKVKVRTTGVSREQVCDGKVPSVEEKYCGVVSQRKTEGSIQSDCPAVSISASEWTSESGVCVSSGKSKKRKVQCGEERSLVVLEKSRSEVYKDQKEGGSSCCVSDCVSGGVGERGCELSSLEFVSCSECEKQYKSYHRLKKHYRGWHKDVYVHQCPWCEFVSPVSTAVSEHKRQSHREEVILCEDCDFSSTKWSKWSTHWAVTQHRLKDNERVEKEELDMKPLSTAQAKLECVSCGYVGRSYKRLKKHYGKHHAQEVLFECDFCDYVTVESCRMKDHKKVVHPHERMLCNQCAFSSRKWTKWLRHQKNGHVDMTNDKLSKAVFSESTDGHKIDKARVKSESEEAGQSQNDRVECRGAREDSASGGCQQDRDVPAFVCQTCHKAFQCQSYLNTHMRNVHPNVRKYSCNECNKSFKTSHNLRKHQFVHSNERNYVCIECNKSFKTSVGLARHSFVHSDVRNYVCNECSKTFKTSVDLKRHTVIHLNVRNFVCNECNKSFKTSGALARHKRCHSTVRNYVCIECNKSFKTPSGLASHKDIHSDSLKYVCNECGKSFNTSYKLRWHKSVHSDGRNYKQFKCSHCDFATKHKQYLKSHIDWHLGVKRYSCTVCSRSFAWGTQLNVHMRIHTGERPYQCQYCEYKTRRNTELKVHLGTHLKIRPYKCTACDFSSIQLSGLKKHTMIHTGEKPFPCPVCGKSFRQKSSMKRHTVRIHFNSC